MAERDRDTPNATAPAPAASGLQTEVAVGVLVAGALLALAGLRVGFKGAVVQIGG